MQTAKADPSLLQSARQTEVGERFNRTLFSALDALEERKIEYALIGGVASSGLGRPRSTHDIDIFVRPEDAGAALEALNQHGFRTEKTDVVWLFKGWKEDILVDVIFKSRGDIYFDQEMCEHAKKIVYHGRPVRTVAPEDLVIIKCVVHDEIGPHHWHDALAVLSHQTIDWDYLLKRARRAPRRLLALLIYAQSNDIWVPNKVLFELFKIVYGDVSNAGVTAMSGPGFTAVPGGRSVSDKEHHGSGMPASGSGSAQKRPADQYVAARVRNAIAQDPRAGDQDIKVWVEGNRILLRGDVVSEEHRGACEEVVREAAPNYQIENQLKVSVLGIPDNAEDVG